MITLAEDNRTGLTLAELARLLERAQASGLPADAVPRARVTMGGKIKRLEVSADA